MDSDLIYVNTIKIRQDLTETLIYLDLSPTETVLFKYI